jgi:prepilin-type N-terminal cleavage/methylation domain-containing protein
VNKLKGASGFTLAEMLIVCLVMGVIAAISVPGIARTVTGARLTGDARNVANAIATAKIRAAAKFTRVRLFVNQVDDTYHVEWFDRTAGTDGEWQSDGGTRSLSSGVSFGYADVAAPPPSSHAAVGDTPQCLTNPPAPVAIGNTACIMFNSRGIPIDDTGAATASGVIYVQDEIAVYGVAVAATGMVGLWRTYLATEDTWVRE